MSRCVVWAHLIHERAAPITSCLQLPASNFIVNTFQGELCIDCSKFGMLVYTNPHPETSPLDRDDLHFQDGRQSTSCDGT